MSDSTRNDPFSVWPNGAAPMAEAWLRMSRLWVETAGRCGARMVAFMGERLQADLEHGKRLAACKDVSAFNEAQGDWLKAMLEDYRRELQAMTDEMWRGLKAIRDEVAEPRPAEAPAGAEKTAPARERRAAA